LGNYLRARRLSIAASFLTESRTGILDIAIECGFGSHEAFSRSFKAYFGKTPKELRSNPPEIITSARPALTIKSLEHLNRQNLKPTIVSLPKRYLAGIEAMVPSPLTEVKSNYEELKSLWREFYNLLPNIEARKGDHYIGLAKSSGGKNEEHYLTYFAACEVSENRPLNGKYDLIEVPAKEYAVFINEGKAGSVVHLTDYIYGTWLPNADYLRDHGDDFELFFDDYVFNSDMAKTHYHVPIKSR
jgi:AraC family transcriptional regulator